MLLDYKLFIKIILLPQRQYHLYFFLGPIACSQFSLTDVKKIFALRTLINSSLYAQYMYFKFKVLF